MEKIEISMKDYKLLESAIDGMSEEKLIKSHTALINKTCKNDYREIKDCAVEFIDYFLCRDWGRSIVYHYNGGAIKFIYSKYLSDYFKNSITELLKDDVQSEILSNALNSDKNINDMSEEEIKEIHLSIKEHYRNVDEERSNISGNFLTYLFKLDGKGVTSYIKNNIDKLYFVSRILLTSGLNDRASFYSGRGVVSSDLCEKNLIEIFKKLIKYDTKYGINFVNMVMDIETLGATEFINSFKNFAANNFKYEKRNIEKSNISLDGVEGDARYAVGVISIFGAMNNSNKDFQIEESKYMKTRFISAINPILKKINPDFYEEINSQDCDEDYDDEYDDDDDFHYTKTKSYWR